MWKLRNFIYSILIQEIIILLLFTVLYGIHATHLAVTQPIWLDEWYTVCVATMPTLKGLFELLWSGPDVQPPLFYLITRSVISILGESDFALRLPAIIGFWVFCISLYAFVRLSGGGVAAASVAMMLPRATNYFFYAREARPYGLVLGCIGLGLVCWRLADITRYRKYSLWMLAFSLSLATCLHYFAIFSFITFWIVEVFSLIQSRKVSLVSLSHKSIPFLGPTICLALHFPLLHHKYRTLPFWKSGVQVSEVISMYYEPFLNFRCILLLILVLLLHLATNSKQDHWSEHKIIVLAISFVFLPCIFFIIIFFSNKTFFLDKYFLSYLIGFSIILSKPLWSIEVKRLGHFVFLSTILVYVVRHQSDFIFPWERGKVSIIEKIEKSKILSDMKEQELLFITDPLYFSVFYYKNSGKSKYLYLTSSYLEYSEKMKVWRNIIPEIQKNPVCPRFFFPENLLELNYLHYVLINRHARGSVEIEFPEIKSEYVIDYESEDFLLYRRKVN